MLKKFFAPALLVAFFASFFAFFPAACSSGGGGGGDSSSSSDGYTSIAVEDPMVDLIIQKFDISLKGGEQENLEINFTVRIKIEDEDESKFDSVLIKLDGVNINEDKAIGKVNAYSFIKQNPNYVDVSAEKYCGKEIQVCYVIYANKNEKPVKDDCKIEERKRENCEAAVASSSSEATPVVDKPFEKVLFGGEETVKIVENQGVNLNTGASANPHFTLDRENNSLRAQGAVKITDNFYKDDNSCKSIKSSDVSDPTSKSTANFVPCTIIEDSEFIEYYKDYYYLVKVSGSEWGPGWYLVKGDGDMSMIGGAGSVTIRAWKVN